MIVYFKHCWTCERAIELTKNYLLLLLEAIFLDKNVKFIERIGAVQHWVNIYAQTIIQNVKPIFKLWLPVITVQPNLLFVTVSIPSQLDINYGVDKWTKFYHRHKKEGINVLDKGSMPANVLEFTKLIIMHYINAKW